MWRVRAVDRRHRPGRPQSEIQDLDATVAELEEV